MKRISVFLILAILLVGLASPAGAAPATHDYLVSTTAPLAAAQVDQLRAAGAQVTYVYENFGGAAITITPEKAANVRALPFVTQVEEDGVYELASLGYDMGPAAESQLPGLPNWLDLMNAENNTTYDGSGVWVAVIDSGFYPNWRDYFREDSILTQYGKAFIGANATPNENQWDVGSSPHAMAVASMIVGYRLVDRLNQVSFGVGYLTGQAGTYWVPGVAPGAKIIPVKICEPLFCGASNLYAAVDYITSLKKANPDQPIVINLSLGYNQLRPLAKAAYDAAIGSGVIIVAAAGNKGEQGMNYPAAYEPVISVGAGAWRQLWHNYPFKTWWLENVDERGVDEVFVTNFSSRPLGGQYLDVVSVGWGMVQPWPCSNLTVIFKGLCVGKASPDNGQSMPYPYVFGWGTSLASPTIAGVVALILQKNPTLNNADAEFGTIDDPGSWGPGSLEMLLENSATDIPGDSVPVKIPPYGMTETQCWETDGCEMEATGHGWVFVDDALAVVP